MKLCEKFPFGINKFKVIINTQRIAFHHSCRLPLYPHITTLFAKSKIYHFSTYLTHSVYAHYLHNFLVPMPFYTVLIGWAYYFCSYFKMIWSLFANDKQKSTLMFVCTKKIILRAILYRFCMYLLRLLLRSRQSVYELSNSVLSKRCCCRDQLHSQSTSMFSFDCVAAKTSHIHIFVRLHCSMSK